MTDKFVHPSVLEKLVVGRRVRYLGDYECNALPVEGSRSAIYGAVGHESTFHAQDKTGTIERLDDNWIPGHPYAIRMHERYTFGGGSWNCVIAAAHELALVEEEEN